MCAYIYIYIYIYVCIVSLPCATPEFESGKWQYVARPWIPCTWDMES